MNPKLKIAFFGTSDRSIPILESISENFTLVLCVTKCDTKVGRDKQIRETAVKKWAREKNIKFIEVTSLKDENKQIVLTALRKTKPDYGVVADFSYMIPEEIINFFERKLINIHFSLLPKYRGASPVQFAILNGDEMTGVTYQLISKRLDAGDILGQIGYKMNHTETSGNLYETLFNVASDRLPGIIEGYESESIKPIPQNEDNATYTYSRTHPHHTHIFKEDGLINWKNGAENIHRKIRALNPWPIAWTYLGEMAEAGCLLQGKLKLREHVDKGLIVKIFSAQLENGKLAIETLQLEGKKVMTWKEFENGYLA